MLKAGLKEKWSNYCDTDKLVDDMMSLLSKYNHRNTEYGVCAILDEYFTNKRELIDMLTSSSNYIGDMRVVIDVELERTSNIDEVRGFCYEFPKRVEASKAILEYADEFGKTIDDYICTGIRKLHAKDLFDAALQEKLNANSNAREKFMDDGSTKKSSKKLDIFYYLIRDRMGRNYQPTLSQDVVDCIKQYEINASFAAGMKTSRAFNRLCSYYGVDKLPEYNKLYAKYADMVSGLKRKLKFYISVNPLDYLTMSFGVNWASCHTIDKTNARQMPNSYSGAYCGGTMSYMLDKTSIITYVHDKMTTDVEEGKIYRNMFHYGDDILIQGRIYPQGNDGATDLYSEFRKIVQDEFSELLNLEDDTWVRRKSGCGGNTSSHGVHYRDYLNFSECNVTYPKERSSSYENIIDIGHNRICPHCGARIDGELDTGALSHHNCTCINDILERINDEDLVESF